MSGELVGILIRRSKVFLREAERLASEGELDLALFMAEQSAQLRVKASLQRLFGAMPRLHGLRALLGMLARGMEEAGSHRVAEALKDFLRDHRDELLVLEDAYTGARYGYIYSDEALVSACLEAVRRLHGLLEEVEEV